MTSRYADILIQLQTLTIDNWLFNDENALASCFLINQDDFHALFASLFLNATIIFHNFLPCHLLVQILLLLKVPLDNIFLDHLVNLVDDLLPDHVISKVLLAVQLAEVSYQLSPGGHCAVAEAEKKTIEKKKSFFGFVRNS